MYWFTSDEHYGHAKILQYCNRPFSSIEEHDQELIDSFNSQVSKQDITIHAGDFCWCNNYKDAHTYYISKLNGTHIFLMGSHDHWLPDSTKYIYRKRFDGQLIVVCHYSMRVWEGSHYNSWHLYGHSHQYLESFGKSFDIGVDGNYFYPYSLDDIKRIMSTKPDNFNLVKEKI